MGNTGTRLGGGILARLGGEYWHTTGWGILAHDWVGNTGTRLGGEYWHTTGWGILAHDWVGNTGT